MGSGKRFAWGVGALGAAVILVGWYGAVGGTPPPRLRPELPRDGSRCVEAAEAMVAGHPALLARWREAVVRDGLKEHVSPAGERHVMSLTGTCLRCHADRDTFCKRCHDYASVHENCWDCHVDRK